jgi:hypothetical protein
MRSRPPGSPAPADLGADEESCLLPATRLRDFLAFVGERAAGGAVLDKADLAESWRRAAARFAAIQVAEAGAADRPEVLPLPRGAQAHVDRLLQLPSFRRTFSTVPVAFGLVELDKLVAYQQYLTGSSLDQVAAALPASLTAAALAKLCLPLAPPRTGFSLARREGDQFVFLADNHDGRFLGAHAVEPSSIAALPVQGHARSVIALAFGFTSNALNVVRFGSRMVLNNGYHRAVALRALGVTHAPCIIQVCGNWDEVGLAGSRTLYEHGDVFFNQARPPLLRDFANPRLVRTFTTRRLRKEIRLSFKVESLKLAV